MPSFASREEHVAKFIIQLTQQEGFESRPNYLAFFPVRNRGNFIPAFNAREWFYKRVLLCCGPELGSSFRSCSNHCFQLYFSLIFHAFTRLFMLVQYKYVSLSHLVHCSIYCVPLFLTTFFLLRIANFSKTSVKEHFLVFQRCFYDLVVIHGVLDDEATHGTLCTGEIASETAKPFYTVQVQSSRSTSLKDLATTSASEALLSKNRSISFFN